MKKRKETSAQAKKRQRLAAEKKERERAQFEREISELVLIFNQAAVARGRWLNTMETFQDPPSFDAFHSRER